MDQKRPRGRPRQFDETEVLDAALAEFWRSGYGATSLDDLGQAMGLNKPSIYASFGNKEVLFERVLDRYMSTYGQSYLDALNATGDLTQDLKAHFDAFIDVVTGRSGPGCPLACTLPAETENSARIRDKLREFLDTADRETAARLRRAQRDGQLDDQRDVKALAQMIVGTMFSISIRARAGATRRELKRIAATVIASVGVIPG